MSTSNTRRLIRASHSLLASALLALLAFATPAAAAPGVNTEADGAPASGVEPPGVVNLNTASEAELLRLPGVGPAKAQAILALREQMKGFRRIEDLMRVKGIGRKTFRDLRTLLTLEGPTSLADKRPGKASR